MPETRQPGKLAVILHADIAGSTLLVQQDEHLAHERIQTSFRRFSDMISGYHGHVRELRGDALLAEFGRASDAVTAALAFQAQQGEYTDQLDNDIVPMVRVGIAIGEVVIADDTVTGAGVVLAQRVEQLAEPGGVCITGAISEALPQRMPFDQQDLGEREVKGFAKAVHVYGVAMKPGEAVPPPEKTQRRNTSNVLGISAAVAAMILLIAGGATFWFELWAPEEEPASMERMAFPLPDKPSIAVLPFDNLSGVERQEYFADGITNDIITDLSKFKNLFVIAGNSTFSYKGKAIKVQQVAEELGVRYILEGSIQSTDDKLRINAQLVDAIKGHHLWAERYDRDASDFFAIQEDIVRTIVASLAFQVQQEEIDRAVRADTDNLKAYDYYQRGWEAYFRFTKEANGQAREYFEKAIELDPGYARAYAFLTWTHINDSPARWSWGQDPGRSLDLALEAARKAVLLGPDDYYSYWALGFAHLNHRNYDRSLAEYERALALNSNDSELLAEMVDLLVYIGRAEQAVTQAKKAVRISPRPPDWVIWNLGWAQYFAKQYEGALATLNRMSDPPNTSRRLLAAVLVRLGRTDEARDVISTYIETNLETTLEEIKEWPWKHQEYLNRYLDDLRTAGLPKTRPLPLPEKPSIAVLPFTNMSDDPQQEYFVDGMTEDLITDLSKLSGLFVIARNSSFTYKGKVVDTKDVSRDLGVRYVMEGSVRRVGNQVRINAQLIDATTGGHLWAERYDGALEDVFSLQDQVTKKIVSALAINLTDAEQKGEKAIVTSSPKAYDAFLKGWEHYRQGTPDGLKKAIAYLEQAIELDPIYTRAYAALAAAYWRIYSNRWYEQVLGVGYSFPAMEKARAYLKEARKPPTPLAHQVAAEISAHLDDGSEKIVALTQAKLAIDLDPNDPASHLATAMALLKYDKAGQAERSVREAMRLDPRYPNHYLVLRAWTEFAMARYADAATTLEQAINRGARSHRTYLYLAASYGQLGRQADARTALGKANELRAKAGWAAYTLSSIDELVWIGDSTLFKEGLRKAGVPPSRDEWSKLIEIESTEGRVSEIEIEGTTKIDVERAKALHEQGIPFIDVSKPWYQEHIPGSKFLMIWFTGRDTEFNEVRLARIVERDQPLVIYSSGLERRAVNACAMAVSWGFQQVYYFENGLQQWKEAGHTLAKGS